MGLSVALSNALSGMKTNQASLDVLSRNISNAGTPGYHKQSLGIEERLGSGVFATTTGVTRAFNQSLQANYTRQISDASYADVRAEFLDQLQSYFGKVGATGSLDTTFANFQQSLAALSTSPDNLATRADVLNKAQTLATTLNRLSGSVQDLRQDTENQMSGQVANLNAALTSLAEINQRLLADPSATSSRANLLDQRDRLVAQVAEVVDVQATYRANGTVALMTRSGVGLLDEKASQLEFNPAGQLTPASVYSREPGGGGVGSLVIRSPAGLSFDLVGQDVLRSGALGALVQLRDETLVTAQRQLDDIAAALAQAMSTVEADGTAATGPGGATGLDIDLSAVRAGDDFELSYTEGGVAKTVRVVRVEDASKLPMDRVDENGTRIIGLSFAGGTASVATALGGLLGANISISNPSGSTLRILDDGAAGLTDINGLKTRTTVSGVQGQGLALSLFVDSGNTDFTDDLGGATQRLGFAARISVNTAVLNDSRLLVQYEAGGTLGDSARADLLIEQLSSLRFSGSNATSVSGGTFRLSGAVGDMVAQAIDFQGASAQAALAATETQQLALESLSARMSNEYGVNIDEEMARLMELQNAYSANARVVAVMQELLDALMQAM